MPTADAGAAVDELHGDAVAEDVGVAAADAHAIGVLDGQVLEPEQGALHLERHHPGRQGRDAPVDGDAGRLAVFGQHVDDADPIERVAVDEDIVGDAQRPVAAVEDDPATAQIVGEGDDIEAGVGVGEVDRLAQRQHAIAGIDHVGEGGDLENLLLRRAHQRQGRWRGADR